MKNRRSDKVDLFLRNFNIEWHDVFGYVRDFDGESGIPCSVNFIESLERLMYKYKQMKLVVNGGYYWGEHSLLDLMSDYSKILTTEYEYIKNTSPFIK